MNKVIRMDIFEMTEEEFKFIESKGFYGNLEDIYYIEFNEKGEPVDCWLAY